MTTESPPIINRTFREPPRLSPYRGGVRPEAAFAKRWRAALLAAAGVLAVAVIALLDFATDTRLSLSVLYLLPVVACAWGGGFSPGVLVSLSGAVAWNIVDWGENPALPPAIRVWNGVVRFGVLVLMASLVSRLRVSIHRERLLARTDSLTGAANGRTFYETVAAEAERSRRAGRPLTLAYLDLDNFKQLNDRLGHAAGDAALQCVVETIQLHLRSADLLARLGGDEFGLLLPETTADGAEALLSRLQEQLQREMSRKTWPVTLSVGAVTFLQPPADIDLMVQRVDALMYAAKRKGKGRVEHTVVAGGSRVTRPAIDRRATVRLLCNCTARVRREGRDEGHEEFGTVRDISAGGVSLHLENQAPLDTMLVVEPLLPGARTLLARVRYTTEDEGGWRHGCELTTWLSADELTLWTGERAGKV